MIRLESFKLSRIFAIIILVFGAGFIIYGAWSFKTLGDLKVNGPIYKSIAQNKDLVADILPPPEYILETYLTVLQLVNEPDNVKQEQLIQKLENLKSQYFSRHEFWVREKLNSDLENVFLSRSFKPAQLFYDITFKRLIPAVRESDDQAAKLAMSDLKIAYESHRQAIDEVVRIANKKTSEIEFSAKARIQNATLLMLVILAISMIAGLGIAEVAKRSLLKQLGAEPQDLGEASQKIAAGNLDIELPIVAGDKESVMFQIDQMRQQLKDRIKREISDERSKTHQATLFASYHYLNNALNQFQLILLELEANNRIDEALMAEIKESIYKTAKEMREFGQLEDPTRENVEKFITERL